MRVTFKRYRERGYGDKAPGRNACRDGVSDFGHGGPSQLWLGAVAATR
jgi:hypothetical protein